MLKGIAREMRWVLGAAVPAGIVGDPATAQTGPVDVGGGLNVVGQTVSDDRIRSEVVGSMDVFIDVRVGKGVLHAYVEANTTPRSGGVSTRVARANTDAGTALGADGRGRAQLSELRLVWPMSRDVRVHLGLLDSTGYLDVSRIANDENLFFIGSPFVNNPTIDFPDYAIGAAVEGGVTPAGTVRIGVTLTSSAGLADNPSASYRELLELDAPGKGLFSGVALRWVDGRRRLSLGGWIRTNDVEVLNDPSQTSRNRGIFSVVEWALGEHSVAGRIGIANGDVSRIRAFGGLTYLWAQRPNAVGLAVGKSLSSSLLSGLENVSQGEVFTRRRLVDGVFVTLSLQRIENPNFGRSRSTIASSLWVWGARLSVEF